MSAEELLPCPFCGGPAKTFNYDGALQATCHGSFKDCAGSDVVAPVAMWNRRTPPAMSADHIPDAGNMIAPVEAVAWRVKDYADGWILFHHEAPARKSGEARNGALIQPLYTHPPQPDAQGWRDIATAPRDGTDCVLWDGHRARFGSWRIDEGFASKEPMWLDNSYDDFSCGFASVPITPTHWQPLPPPPSADSLGGDVAKRNELKDLIQSERGGA